MQDKGLVSIIMPSYNCVDYVGESINSILEQTYTNWELLITDDCSTDSSLDVLHKYAEKDSRIKVFTSSKNGGPGAARNNSIEKAKGRFIAFCDSDDRWVPEKLEKQLELMHEKNAGCCFGSYYECTEDGKPISIVEAKPILTFNDEKHANQIGCLTGIYDTDVVGKQFMPLIRKRQDWALWLNIMKITKCAYAILEPCAYYRIRANSISRNKLDLIKYNAAIYEEIFHYPHWKALLYTLFINIPTYFLKRRQVKSIN